eukprot:3939741-Heterocapsa_arctica.AAC.1
MAQHSPVLLNSPLSGLGIGLSRGLSLLLLNVLDRSLVKMRVCAIGRTIWAALFREKPLAP